jgi:hypothetical protein
VTTPVDQLPPLLAIELARLYDVLRPLGRGGMGVVWLARERSLDRLVAIKVLAGQDVESSDTRERFRREARVAARLAHPHIVPLYAFGETPDALYFVMGYVDGETLATRLYREGRLGRQLALRILSEISDALAFAHREGVIHRDVKPENILLDARSGRAMLADFGVARIDSAGASVTMTGVAVGTPGYMSPEQAVGARDIDGRSDLYSLGVVGYRMLAGRLPFTATSVQALLAQHAGATPDDLTLAVGAPERRLAAVIMRALEKAPAARWARAEDLSTELRTAAQSAGALPAELEHVQSSGTRRVALWLLAAVTGNLTWFVATITGGSRIAWGPFTLFMDAGWAVTLGALGLVGALPAIRKFGWRETLRTMFQPPASWASWWPRSLRRFEDLWDRLPAPLRRARNAVATTAAAFLTMALTSPLSGGLMDGRHPLFFGWLGAMWLFVGWAGVEVVRAKKRLGLPWREFGQLLGLPNLAHHPGWAKPEFSGLLAPEAPDVPAVRAPRTPDELVRAIAELSRHLSDAGLLPEDDSAGAAHSVRAAIESLESEIRRLSAELDPAEGDRVERRLAALTGAGDAELRRLLEGQRELWERLRQRVRDKEARREHLREQLTTLWMQLFELDARLTRGSPPDPELTGRVRALCQEIGRAGEALTEAEQLLAPRADATADSLP